MENTKTWNDCGMTTEQLVNITKEFVYQLLKDIDIKGAVHRMKEKFPDITEDQWSQLLNDEDSYPDMTKPDWMDEMDNEMHITELLTNLFTPPEEESSEPELEKLN